MWWLLIGACATHRYPDGSGLTGQLEREIVALRLRVADLERGTSPVPSGPDPLVGELHQVFSGTDVTVAASPGGCTLSVPTQLVFADPAGGRVREESAFVFGLLSTALATHSDVHALVIGHTSDRALPKRRGAAPPTPLGHTADLALLFAAELVSVHGVAPERVSIAARGSWAPVASNDLPSGQDANERVDVRLIRPDSGIGW